jgi:nucleotide-binding universal stress UspA family protein
MLNIKKILLPVDFPNTSLSVIHQAAAVARYFHSDLAMLHVLTQASQMAGVPEDGSDRTGWDLLAEILKEAQKNQDQTLEQELKGLTIQRVLAKGGVARAIVLTAQAARADLIMMPSRGHTFDEFLLGTETTEVLNGTECPVWTAAHTEELPVPKPAIRNILCAIDFKPHDRQAVSWAARIASEFGAHLTIAHVTAGVEFWGPGGSYVKQKWKEALVSNASRQIAEIQQRMGLKADVFIGSGHVPRILCQAAKQTKADLLVTGCRPYGGHLRTHGYAIICAVPIPVLSV